jgi:hypothetical protein
MKLSFDNQIVRLFADEAEKVLDGPLKSYEESSIHLSWPSFLEYLELGDLLSRLPPFDEQQLLFKATTTALCEVDNPEDLFYIYDSLFTTVLKQIKSLPEMEPEFLIEKINQKRNKLSFWEMEKFLSPALAAHERALRKNAVETMHDLVLYLAWDRMCVCMGRLFDFPSTDLKFQMNLKRLRWCLIESFQHISGQGKTTPSFYRLMEALFYYQMREEHLQIHSESDWELLQKSFPVLKDQNELVDLFYIDHAISNQNVSHLTLDPPETIQSRIALAKYMIGQLKEEIPEWNLTLHDCNIIHL